MHFDVFFLLSFANQKHIDVPLVKWTNTDEGGVGCVEIQELEGSFSLKVDHPHASPVMIALRLKKKRLFKSLPLLCV